jgi:uncharacterized protein
MSGIAKRILEYFARYAAYAGRRPWVPLIILLVVAAGALVAASQLLRLDPRFDALLPSGTPSVEARAEARKRMGSSSLYLIAVRSPDPVANYQMSRDLARKISQWKETVWVLHRRDTEVFRKHALLYTDPKDLKELAVTLKRVVDRALQRARAKASGWEPLDDEEEEEIKKKDRADKDRLRALGDKYRFRLMRSKREGLFAQLDALLVQNKKLNKSDEARIRKAYRDALAAFRQPTLSKRLDHWLPRHKELTAGQRKQLRAQIRDALINDSGDVTVVIAQLTKGTNNVEFARRVYLKGEGLIRKLGPEKYHPDMIARVGGAYRSFREFDQAISDIRVASIASLLMVLGLLVVFFRRVRSIVVVLVPLLVGIAWAAGFAALAFGQMNIITSFIAAILIGLGIDFAIHLYAAYRSHRLAGEDMEQGLSGAVREAGPGMFTAAVTTMAALLTLVAAHFRAFNEFGYIAAMGLLLCLLAALLVMPPVIAVLERLRAERFPAPKERTPSKASVKRTRRLAMAGGGVALIITAVLAWRAPSIAFEYDFKELRGKGAAKTGIAYDSAMRGSSGTAPMVLLADSESHIRLAHKELLRRQKAEQKCCDVYLAGGAPQGKWCKRMGLTTPRSRRIVYTAWDGARKCRPRVRDIVTVATFIPEGQQAKLPHIRMIRETLKPTKKKGDPIEEASKDIRKELRQLRDYAQIDAPLTAANLPHWAQRSLTEKVNGPDGKPRMGAIGLVYSSLHFRDVRDMIDMSRDYAQLDVGAKPVRLAAGQFVISEVVDTVQKDGRQVFLYAFVAVLLLLLLDLLSVSGALICFATLTLGFLWSLGAMQWLDLKLGVYNMLVVPTALGVGIDGSVHLYHRFKRLGPKYAESPLGHTGAAVIASSITTTAGFAGLFFIAHGGLRTIANFATLSILLTLGGILTILPGLLIWRSHALQKKQAQPKD